MTRRGAPVVLALLVAVLVGSPGTGAVASPAAYAVPAQPPPPTPPPNPNDQDLQRSRDDVAARSAEVGRLTARLGELADEQDDLQIQVATQHESANQARDVSDQAGREAAAAADAAAAARTATEKAAADVNTARDRLDAFVAGVYGHGLDLGPLGLLSRATDPQDLMDRARLTDEVSRDQADALDQLQRAQVTQANADSKARAAQEEADRRKAAAEEASAAADAALTAAEKAADDQRQRLDAVTAEQASVQQQLDAAQNSDATLRGQRQRYLQYQAQQAAAEAEQARRDRDAARSREAAREESAPSGPAPRKTGSGAVETVIDRAMSQIGVRYSWGGGNKKGPTVGIRDGGEGDAHGDYKNEGFDCSGLMLYAFAGIGIDLPRYSGNQANAGEKVPVDQMKRGDMLSWAENGRTYHIAIYLGDGKMLEAPYSGSEVKVSPVRYKHLSAVTRMV
ncbi:NlpC/P60 family protein [Pseudonocardia endophytica]|uniref:Cell wall-associated NlpC family hydrolase n=1 Tax=Pseudonocardia endophytica TaxID=401976 RepID=A0A4R1HTU7_PSEEN|nr:NlpC/P60 family protein [Pseudonocardia endophytica]TCK24335.1 cell wall-associated NlpC family hydrolase [Pseudonocardia endophytica]